MSSSTSSSKPGETSCRKLVLLYGLSLILTVAAIGFIELGMRRGQAAHEPQSLGVDELMASLPNARISGREIGNQMLVHNVAFFSAHPNPDAVSTGYVGTSRSKILRPGSFGIPDTVVGAGNSYNEISYGLLLQAEILRLQFPKLKRMFVESSMLLRKPARLIVEDDHLKYLPLLKTIEPLCNAMQANTNCHSVFAGLQTRKLDEKSLWQLQLLKHRESLRISGLFVQDADLKPVNSDNLFSKLAPNGELKELPRARMRKEDQPPKIGNEHIKVQRLRDTTANAPWDGLFDLFVQWGRVHGIEIIFFQPPVRADLHELKVPYGLSAHNQDLEVIAQRYKVPYIDLNKPGLGYLEDWSLFSDEDHMETCAGSGLLTLALELGYQRFKQDNTVLPKVPRGEVEAAYSDRLSICSSVESARSAASLAAKAAPTSKD